MVQPLRPVAEQVTTKEEVLAAMATATESMCRLNRNAARLMHKVSGGCCVSCSSGVRSR